MKKFIKFSFVVAMILIIVGGVFYMLGRKDGREEMNELLSEFGADWMNVDWSNNFDFDSYDLERVDIIDFGSYDINDSSIFNDNYAIWSGDVKKQTVYQGSIDELSLEIGGSMVKIEDSDDGDIYIEGKNVGKMQAYVAGDTLYVKSVRPANLMDEVKNSTITLYLPNNSLQLLDVSLGAGQLKLENLAVRDMAASIGAGQLIMEDMDLGTLKVALGAGELQAEDVTVENLTASIGAGNMDFSGGIYRSAEISCSMGNVDMELEGDKDDFNYQLNCVAGNMDIDGDRYSGAAMERYIDNGAAKTITIDCSMGNVEVDF